MYLRKALSTALVTKIVVLSAAFATPTFAGTPNLPKPIPVPTSNKVPTNLPPQPSSGKPRYSVFVGSGCDNSEKRLIIGNPKGTKWEITEGEWKDKWKEVISDLAPFPISWAGQGF